MIDTLKPVDKLAALVTSKVDVSYKNYNPGSNITSMTKLPTAMWQGPRKYDLTGRKCGRFTVIGFSLWKPANWATQPNATRWVVRCSCGRYQVLSTKAINKAGEGNMCVECRSKQKH